jgi:hypothetical protein
MPRRSSSRKVTKASAGTRRKRPIRTDSTAPELTSEYMRGSSDAKPIGRFFHGKDKRQPDVIKLRALPCGALGFLRMAGVSVRTAHLADPF